MIINCTPHDVAIYNTADCYMYNGSLYLREGDEEYPEPLSVYPAAKEPARAIYVQRTAGLVYRMRRKTPPFRAGDIRRVRRICVSN